MIPNSFPHISQKILSRNTLAGVVRTVKQQRKTIVTTNGSFDLLHIGHVTMLQEAKSLGDVLIVGLNSDASVQRYKGRYRPICPQKHRTAMVAALECTDYVTIFEEDTPIELLRIIQPDIHVNSPEHGKDCVEREVVEQHGGRIHVAQLVEGMSTSHLIEHILDAASHTPCRGIFLRPHAFFETAARSVEVFRMIWDGGFHIFLLSADPEHLRHHDMVNRLRREGVDIHAVSSMQSAVREYDVILAKSLLVSSTMADIQMGRECNAKTVLLSTTPNSSDVPGKAAAPHFTVQQLEDVPAVLPSSEFQAPVPFTGQ